MQCTICKKFCEIDDSDFKLIHKCYRLYCHKIRDFMGIKITKITTLNAEPNQEGMSYKKCIQELLIYFLTTEELCAALRMSRKEIEVSPIRKCLIFGPPDKWKHFKQFDSIEDVYRTIYGVDWKKSVENNA
jgi:hypothetical protein